MSKRILFICKHNRFRSKTAEIFFSLFNKNKKYTAMSAGLFPGSYPLDKIQVKVAKEFGITLQGKPRPITTDLLRTVSIVVIVTDDVPAAIFHNEKYKRKEYVWNIPDVHTHSNTEIRGIIAAIKKRVIQLVRELA